MARKKYFFGKRILITGVSGTVGRCLAGELGKLGVSEIVGLDNNESALYLHAREKGADFRPILGDIRDKETLESACRGMDIVFHLAALKHVPLCEVNPLEAVRTNILGVKNIISAAQKTDVEAVINTSTDKVVNPFNVMGTSKLMGEQLIRAANLCVGDTRFFSTRFGNVLGSSGSVVPIFKTQIQAGQSVTLTSREMTRFVMTLEEAVELIIDSLTLAVGGEIFVTKMKAIRVLTLAEVMIGEIKGMSDPEAIALLIREIGARPGEKVFEELMSDEEARRSIERDNYYTIMPALTDIYQQAQTPVEENVVGIPAPYNSAAVSPMEEESLRRYLLKNALL